MTNLFRRDQSFGTYSDVLRFTWYEAYLTTSPLFSSVTNSNTERAVVGCGERSGTFHFDYTYYKRQQYIVNFSCASRSPSVVDSTPHGLNTLFLFHLTSIGMFAIMNNFN
jgi:hypothetical protein